MTDVDADRVARFALSVWQYKQGEVVSLMVHLGDRLGLYRALAGAGPVTAAQLAERTGLHERWLREWLRGQAAARLVDSDDGETFTLSPEAACVLADENGSVWFAGGAFHGYVVPPETLDRLADAFRTGIGLSYDDLGPSAAHSVERMLGPWVRLALVPAILPALDGVVRRLENGVRVVDVGCGAGVALAAMAERFPASVFVGYDPSEHAIARARTNTSRFPNVELNVAAAADLPTEPTFDVVLTLDCLHDMPDPRGAVQAIRAAISDDGVWLIKDIRAKSTWKDNLRNPLLAMMYGTSVATCMSSALSTPDGAGLGTLGLTTELAEQFVREEGFTTFTVHDFDDPANLYYEVRP
jgi:2-polyprenyl-3-methyl-5-hydroxy-6-metoxy-1,4-benzoquinol methylase